MDPSLAPEAHAVSAVHAVYPLNEFYARAGLPLPSVEVIAGGSMPEPYRALLVHAQDMTPTLEAHYGDAIHIEVLGREHRGDAYFREVILRLDRDDRPVEFGASRIALDALDPLAKRLILQEQLPIGHILNAHDIPHSGCPSAFLRVKADALMSRALRVAPGLVLYGRRNTLRRADGRVLCQVVEILPPAEPGAPLRTSGPSIRPSGTPSAAGPSAPP